MKIVYANILSLSFLGACIWFVYNGHAEFGIACFIVSALTVHTYSAPND